MASWTWWILVPNDPPGDGALDGMGAGGGVAFG